MARRDVDYDPAEVPWHNRTPEVVGASLLGLVVIALVVFAVSWLVREFNEPEPAPLHFVEPTYSAPRSETTRTATTTQTVTSTRRPETTDLEPGPPPSSTSETTSEPPTTRQPRSDDDDDETTRSRPRTNITRTLNPFN